MNEDIRYEFTVSENTVDEYKISKKISEWLHDNLSNLTDDKGDTLFNKVNYGFNEDALKTFGKKPVCDVYANKIEYSTDFDSHVPESVHSTIIFYLKGANNNAYLKASEIHDYILQQFMENDSFKRLQDVVKNTYILNSELMNQPINKKWGVMGAFELSHILY